ncbi:hypothetical protein [Xanthobacter sp. 126]|uniref:DUF6968 family protein n=1 Tax=Xanthobacter sp. 126 TaxID=1131814 RepID=UPI00045EA545|nr:hypothetical protein [Xanthobacter sp. 126]
MLILTHKLHLKRLEGEVPIEIRIYKPEPKDGCWACAFEIDWPEGTKAMSGAGFDALQALVISLQMIGIQIYTSSYHHDGALRAYDTEEGYGFPVSRNVRDVLIGADKIYL